MTTFPLFVIGTQRSGTTLLQLILNAHSQIAIAGEAPFLVPLLKKRALKGEISGPSLQAVINDLTRISRFKAWGRAHDYSDYLSQLSKRGKITLRELIKDIFSAYSSREGKRIWGNKMPSFFRKIDILFALFPDAKFIHIVRDGRDTFDSWRKLDPLANPQWNPIINNNAPLRATDWSYKLFKIERAFNKIPHESRITIRYEDLLENPEKTLKSICSRFGIEYEANMLEYYRTSRNNITIPHSSLILKPLDKNNKYKWKRNLTVREIRSYTLLARHFLKKYNYDVEVGRISILDMLSIIKNISTGIPMRIAQVLRAKKLYDKAVRKRLADKSIHVGQLPQGALTREPRGEHASGKNS